MRRAISYQAQMLRAFSGVLGKTAVIYPAAFGVSVAHGLLTLGIVFYAATVFEASRVRIGLLAGVWSLTYVIGCQVLRPAFYRTLPRYLIVGSTAVMSLLTWGMLLSESLAQIFVCYALFGLVLSLFWPPMMGWLATGSEGSQLGRVMGQYNLSWCSGVVVSPLICGWLFQRGPTYPLVVASVLLLWVCAFVAGASVALPRVKGDRQTGMPAIGASGAGANGSPLRAPARIGLFASFFGMGMLVSVFPLAARDVAGMSETAIGGLFLVRGLTNTIAFVWLGRAAWWHQRRYPMLVGLACGALFFGLLAGGAATVWLAIGFGIYGISMAMAYFGSAFHGVVGGMDRARGMVVHESVLASGIVVGSSLGGWVYQVAGSRIAFLVAAGVLMAAMAIQSVMGKNFMRASPATQRSEISL